MTIPKEITNLEDLIDSRDVIERIGGVRWELTDDVRLSHREILAMCFETMKS